MMDRIKYLNRDVGKILLGICGQGAPEQLYISLIREFVVGVHIFFGFQLISSRLFTS